MEKARMLGMEEAVVGGTEGGRSLSWSGRAPRDTLSASSVEATQACDQATAHVATGAERAGAATGPRQSRSLS